MTIEACLNCGGTHYGSLKCPYISAPCVVCGTSTIYACSDCAIDGEPTHVCERGPCQDHHEQERHGGDVPAYCSDCHPDDSKPWPKKDVEPRWPTPTSLTVAPSVELAKCDDYDAGDSSLEISKHSNGKYQFTIYCCSEDLTVYDQSAKQAREVARRILALVPESDS